VSVTDRKTQRIRAMSSQWERALEGETVEINGHSFEIKEDMTMTFEGRSCNIFDAEGNVVEQLGTKDGKVTREVRAGFRCNVMKGKIKFVQSTG